MDWLILITITLVSAVMSYRKGALRTALRLLSFIGGYAAAWQLTPALATWLLDTHKMQGVIVYPTAGLLIFISAGILLNVLCAFVLWLTPSSIKEGGKTIGAIAGGIFGLFMALLCVWTIGILQNAIAQRQQAAIPAIHRKVLPTSFPQQLAGKIIGEATETVMGKDNPSSKITSQLLSDPVSVSQGLNYLAQQPDVRDLFVDGNNYRAMVNGTPNEIMQLKSFKNLVNDPTAMAFLSKAGIAGTSPQEQQLALASHFSTYAKNLEQFKNTAEYKAIITDPDINAKLKARDYISLLNNDKVRLLAEILINGSTSSTNHFSNNTNTDNIKNLNSSQNAQQKIYRWQDKNGGVHYSAEPPLSNEAKGDVLEMQQ